MRDYWSVVERQTGRKICECGEERDAMLLVSLDPQNKTYRKEKFILDQVITVHSEGIKELPGQQGLPVGIDKIESSSEQIKLPESQSNPIHI